MTDPHRRVCLVVVSAAVGHEAALRERPQSPLGLFDGPRQGLTHHVVAARGQKELAINLQALCGCGLHDCSQHATGQASEIQRVRRNERPMAPCSHILEKQGYGRNAIQLKE